MTSLLEPYLGKNPETVSISNSEIQSFKDCRRRWYLGNYRGLKLIAKTSLGPLPLGTRIHNALEQYYTTGEHPVDAYNRFQRQDNRRFIETDESRDAEAIKKFNDESELGRIMVEGYVEWLDETNPDANLEVIGAEKKLSYRLVEVDPRVELIGKVDLQVRRLEDGSRSTLDHKSAMSFTTYHKFAHMSEQLQYYTMLEKLNPDAEDPTPVDGGIYNLLKKVKRTARATPPFYERMDIRFNKKTLDAFWIRTQGVIRDMMAARDSLDAGTDHRLVAYPRPRMDYGCGTCPFFAVCPMLDDGSSAEAYIEAFYSQEDPNARYGDEASQEN